VQQALEKERERRQNSAAEVRTQVEQLYAGNVRVRRKRLSPRWRRVATIAGAIVVVIGILRTFFVQPFMVMTDAAAPEIPAGSRILVWKMARTFKPGDLLAYEAGDQFYAGRVARSEGENVIMNRNGMPDIAVPRAAITGKVISVYWRGETPRVETPKGTAGFGPVMEQVLPFGMPCAQCYLQLSGGRIFEVGHGPDSSAEDMHEDLKKADAAGRVDMSAIGGKEGLQLAGEGCLFTNDTREDDPPKWDHQTAQATVDQLKRATWITGVLELRTSALPATYLFKTAGGESGMLELQSIVADKRGTGEGVKMRYRMVQPAPAH
jgi:signal peptidase I